MTLFELTKKICEEHHLKPSRSRGQNFLIDESVYQGMISAAELKGEEIILEIGPGLGFLTKALAERTQKVFSVEIDDRLTGISRQRLKQEGISNVKIFNEDILNFTGQWTKALGLLKEQNQTWSIVANLPYSISAIFLRKFIAGNEAELLPESLTLLLQKEVVERLVALPGNLSILGISVQFYSKVEFIRVVKAEAFWPKPKVDSAIIRIKRDNGFKQKLLAENLTEKDFFRLVKIGFSARRKMLKANLAAGYSLDIKEVIEMMNKAKIDITCRPQALSLDDWLKLLAAWR